MRYYSTRNKNSAVNFATAALTGLAPDGGLFVPEEIPSYPSAVLASLGTMDYCDIAFETIKPYVYGEIPDSVLGDIVQSAYPFAAPLVSVGEGVRSCNRFVLELFHGPTAAFKDFGARFMSRAFSYLRGSGDFSDSHGGGKLADKPLHILVATSGDTGGAVADGFFNVSGISVTVLYPKGRITPLQERQIAGLGGNISALAVEGSFDDCQRLVKAALADENIKKKMTLSSANSINISRLIPQAVYYTAAAAKAPHITLCVPSGNFGNLTAGLYAMKMGAPIRQFIAATNINKTFPDYLVSGEYQTRISQATISNAMDVGAPSNFERMAAHWSLDEMRRIIFGVSVSDEETRETIVRVHKETGYFLDPHSAVGWKGVDKLIAENKIAANATPDNSIGVLSTAHPAKFSETVGPLVGAVPVPESLASAMKRTVQSKVIPAQEAALIEML